MNSFKVEGSIKLSGDITPQGAKNEALQVLCAVLLTKEEVIIENVPEIIDVLRLIDLLKYIGVEVNKLAKNKYSFCLLYTSPSPRDRTRSRMPSSA